MPEIEITHGYCENCGGIDLLYKGCRDHWRGGWENTVECVECGNVFYLWTSQPCPPAPTADQEGGKCIKCKVNPAIHNNGFCNDCMGGFIDHIEQLDGLYIDPDQPNPPPPDKSEGRGEYVTTAIYRGYAMHIFSGFDETQKWGYAADITRGGVIVVSGDFMQDLQASLEYTYNLAQSWHIDPEGGE